MNQYLITGYDFTDADALQRRMNTRPHHLDGIKELKANGNYIIAAAILNQEGNMIGSSMLLQFESAEELEVYKQKEPYITQGVWESVDVKPVKVAAI
jgi:uncharacterized protein YciI